MSTSNENVIEVRDLVVRFGARTVLDGLTFDIRRGEIFVILGGSGGGKSTLLRVLVGLLRPDEGHVLFNGKDLTTLPDDELIQVRRRMGMCFQSSALFNSETVAENVAMPLREHTDLERSTIDIMVKMNLELVGLGGYGDYMPEELSGGMKKRAGLARAMAMDPEIIFYDEPSAGLDPIVAAGIDGLIRKMQHTYGLTSVVVTHEMPSVEAIADRVCMLHRGRILAFGTLDEVRASPEAHVEQFFSRRADEERQDAQQYFESLTREE